MHNAGAAEGASDARRAQIYAAAARAIESAVRTPAQINAGGSDASSVSGSSSASSSVAAARPSVNYEAAIREYFKD